MNHRLRFLGLFCSLSSLAWGGFAHVIVGTVDPGEWGARFSPHEISKAVFCVKRSVEVPNNRHCATAFLISEKGYLLTAHHVEDFAHDHSSSDDTGRAQVATQVLVDQLGQGYKYSVVGYPSAKEVNFPFLKDPQKVIRDEFLRARRTGFQQSSLKNEIHPGHYKKMEAIVLKIDPADVKKLDRLRARAFRLRKRELEKGDSLFVAGFPWTHYNKGFFKHMTDQILQREPGHPIPRPHNGEFSFMTGKFSRYQGNSVVTEASDLQLQGLDMNTDAIDTVEGASGAPVFDADGLLVGVHWASDSSVGRFAPLRRSLITFATDARKVYERFGLDKLIDAR